MTLTIDRVTPDSLDGFLGSVAGLFVEDAGTHDTAWDLDWPEREGRAYYTGLLGDENSLCLLASTENGPAGHLVGQVGGHRMRPGEVIATLVSMRVAEHARRAGVGSGLIAEFMKWANAKNATEAQVTAFAANAGAIDFYQRNGFAPYELTLKTRSGLGG
ncbi:GNAT family N-acetyltransferase [Labedaea rhizosphaerae]|uniref:Acetyltransferase (GNAT) family protein n=1 Tax=Labedaea rhizosphaerae TaxID=598644 RepID=A0A4R6SPH8_LABRH|nr:GNAT family N-acetyltransferase [Labedaea rhizosphaerae]TDQ05967.1 acetyltransferase (GNAT) family protein [Labedaea rhizosphaerae]